MIYMMTSLCAADDIEAPHCMPDYHAYRRRGHFQCNTIRVSQPHYIFTCRHTMLSSRQCRPTPPLLPLVYLPGHISSPRALTPIAFLAGLCYIARWEYFDAKLHRPYSPANTMRAKVIYLLRIIISRAMSTISSTGARRASWRPDKAMISFALLFSSSFGGARGDTWGHLTLCGVTAVSRSI